MKLIRVNSRHRGSTYLQDRRGSLVKTDSTSSENADVPKCWSVNRKKILAGTAIIFVIVLTVVLVLSFNLDNLDAAKVFALQRTAKLGGHKLITREIWGGFPALKFTRDLKTPVDYVLISHTAGNRCSNVAACSVIMQQIQAYHVSLNSPDVGYNFLIGGDGNIYIARGWDVVNFHSDGCIGISFMGNFLYDELTESMIEATKMLLEQGVLLGKLTANYNLIAHNQTYNTISPGPNVYKEIKTWTHFLPGSNISWGCDDCN